MRKLASVNRLAAQRLPGWITLTYPDEWPADRATYMGHLRAFLRRLDYRYGRHAVVWRLEWQRRGAPHFHLLLWDFNVSGRERELSEMWFAVVGSGDRHHLTYGCASIQADSWRGLTAYLSKYMAKLDDGQALAPDQWGRLWGIEGASLLPIEPISWLLSLREGIALRRTLQRHARAHRGDSGGLRGRTVFMQDSTLRHYVETMTKDPVPVEGHSGLGSWLDVQSLPDS